MSEAATLPVKGEKRFELWLKTDMPYLAHIWNFEKGIYLPEKLKEFLEVASSGEAVMARFAIGVWTWENNAGFDIFQAAHVLDEKNTAIITNWLKHPFWP